MTESAQKLLLIRRLTFEEVAKWIAYLKHLWVEPPSEYERRKSVALEAMARDSVSWLDLLTKVRLLVPWIRDFGPALKMWFCTEIEAEIEAMRQTGILQQEGSLPGKGGSLPGKRAWASQAGEMLDLLEGEKPIRGLYWEEKLHWEEKAIEEIESLNEVIIAEIINLAGTNREFREEHYRPHLRTVRLNKWKIRDSPEMHSFYLYGKGRLCAAKTANKRGFESKPKGCKRSA